jgi:hypothetical protein
MRANREDGENGRFFQDRYGATKLVDEASLLACAAYVDLNPIRAAMCETLEQSDHTSVQRRIESLQQAGETNELDPGLSSSETVTVSTKSAEAGSVNCDAFLSPLSIDEQNDPIGPCVRESGKRASDKGFLVIPLEEYLQLLDWTAREVAPGKRGSTPASAPPILQRLGLDASAWCELVSDFGKLFCTVAGRPERVDAMRSPQTHRRFHLRRRARELFSTS